MRMIATTFPSLNACSFVSLLQVHIKFFLTVKVFPSCPIRSSPRDVADHAIHHRRTPWIFDPGCMMMSRIETILKPRMRDGVSPS